MLELIYGSGLGAAAAIVMLVVVAAIHRRSTKRRDSKLYQCTGCKAWYGVDFIIGLNSNATVCRACWNDYKEWMIQEIEGKIDDVPLKEIEDAIVSLDKFIDTTK